MIQQMMKAEFEDKVKLSDITEEQIKAYYTAHPEEFNKPEQVRASHVLLSNQADARKALASLRAAPNDARPPPLPKALFSVNIVI